MPIANCQIKTFIDMFSQQKLAMFLVKAGGCEVLHLTL